MSDRGTAWSVTINNPQQADEDNVAMARQKGWKVEGQKEQGEQGTIHYQLLVKTGQVRFSAVKKAFPRAHIEKARNVTALAQYVTKEDTRVGTLAQSDEQYPSLQRTWDMFYQWDCLEYQDAILMTGEEWLELFDRFVADYIERGYVLEGIAVNPQIRSALKKYGFSIWKRSQNRQITPQTDTDRQTHSNISSVEGITNNGVEEPTESEQVEQG